MICRDCHWFEATKMDKPCSNGKIYPCTNIGVDGWEIWDAEQKAPESCADYCKAGEYVPTGVWADLATVVHKVAEIAGCEK